MDVMVMLVMIVMICYDLCFSWQEALKESSCQSDLICYDIYDMVYDTFSVVVEC